MKTALLVRSVVEVEQTKTLLGLAVSQPVPPASGRPEITVVGVGVGWPRGGSAWGVREGVRGQLKLLCILLSSKEYTNYLALKQP